MKSFISMFLISYFSLTALVPRMDFDELYQIPDFFSHFLEHKESDDNLDIIKYINFHYSSEIDKPIDDHKLPFRDCCSCCNSRIAFAPFLPSIAESFVYKLPQIELLDAYIFHFTSKHISNIWQPPRA